MNTFNDLRKTKIVATVGPVSNGDIVLEKMIQTGVDIFRLNYSHGTKEEHLKTIETIRKISQKNNKSVGILQDLGGPKIRVGELKNGKVFLSTGSTVTLTSEGKNLFDAIPISYKYLHEDVKVGDKILMADGTIELKVEKIDGIKIQCLVIHGGELLSRKGVNLPASHLRIPALTEKDREDLFSGIKAGVDFVALSFVRSGKDILEVKEILKNIDCPPAVIAKIEKPQAVENIDEILALVDAVMVARGDLGVELPYYCVPMIQKEIIKKARGAFKPVITATQMLSSMSNSPRPTRAEAADVANAVLDGTDALMLSDETAVGQFPIEAVTTLHQIAKYVEKDLKFPQEINANEHNNIATAIAKSATDLAYKLKAKAIFASTTSGNSAKIISSFRPNCPIYGLTHRENIKRILHLNFGIFPAICPHFHTADEVFYFSRKYALENGIANEGDLIVIVSSFPIGIPGSTNILKVLKV
jgi:pyruvate kinase